MKYLVFMFFFGLSFTAFSATNVSEVSFEILDNLEAIESKVEIKTNNSEDSAVAFECYYTVEWLYIDSPFIKKLDALA